LTKFISFYFQELWRREIDNDFVYGPFGHRGAKSDSKDGSNITEHLTLTTNATLDNEFYEYAVNVLKLETVT
jgi:hypothetical protein